MATHPIGPGTRNLSVNMRDPLHRALGRVAFRIDVSLGKLVRGLIRLGARVAASGERAKRSQQFDEAALKSIDLATSPESDGGEVFTASELAHVRDLIAKSAHLDSRIAHGLNLKDAIA